MNCACKMYRPLEKQALGLPAFMPKLSLLMPRERQERQAPGLRSCKDS